MACGKDDHTVGAKTSTVMDAHKVVLQVLVCYSPASDKVRPFPNQTPRSRECRTALTSTLQTLDAGDGEGDPLSGARSLHDLTSSSQRDGEDLDEQRQLRMLQRDLQGGSGDATLWAPGRDGSGSGDQVRAIFLVDWCSRWR